MRNLLSFKLNKFSRNYYDENNECFEIPDEFCLNDYDEMICLFSDIKGESLSVLCSFINLSYAEFTKF